MNLTYIDCASGVAGDMLLGGMIGLGLSTQELEKTLQAAIKESGWRLKISEVERQSWPAWALQVQGDRPFGSLDKMKACVRRSQLPASVKQHSQAIFTRLEKAEAAAHGQSTPHLDPHGLGLIDTLVDVLGSCWGFWKLGMDAPRASRLNTGRLAPATAVMLRDHKVPIYSTSDRELATPTGVAILLEFVKEFKGLPEMELHQAGYGAGQQDPVGRPNVVGIYQGKALNSKIEPLEPILLLETVIDDMDPRLYPHVMELVLQAGALDTWYTPIGMKKGRPGIALSVLCRPQDEAPLKDILFQETTTLGIRRHPVDRWVLPRAQKGSNKVALLPGRRQKVQVEFEIAKKAASRRAIPLLKLLK